MTVKFNGVTLHGTLRFEPGVAYAFEDEDAEPYFKAAGWAEDSDEEPVRTFTKGEIDIDPNTVFGTTEHPHYGKRVKDVMDGKLEAQTFVAPAADTADTPSKSSKKGE
jgi:hypothetical protein